MTFFSIIVAILILLVMITVHEFGHYMVGKIFKFKINEFAIGMGPAILKKRKKNGEIFSVRCLPLGGYCAFEGEDEDKKEVVDAFNSKKPWQRILVLIAGAFMNFLLAMIVIIIMFSAYGKSLYQTVEILPTQISIENLDPALAQEYENYSLKQGDSIIEINGRKILLSTDLTKSINGKKIGDKVKCTVLRDGKQVTQYVKLRASVKGKNVTDVQSFCKAFGIATLLEVDKESAHFKKGDLLLRAKNFDGDYSTEKYENAERIFTKNQLIALFKGKIAGDKVEIFVANDNRNITDANCVSTEKDNEKYLISIIVPSTWSGEQSEQEIATFLNLDLVGYYRISTLDYKGSFLSRLGDSFAYSGRVGGVIFTTLGELLTGKLSIRSMGGPVTTVVQTSKVVSMGLQYLLQIIAFIGVNLAVFNLLPIPALDGSRVIFTAIEWIFRKPVPKKIEGVIHTIGLLLLLGFSVLVDVLQLI